MNQQIIFNNDFHYQSLRKAVSFSCLVAGLRVCCFIPLPAFIDEASFLAQVSTDAFYWEDCAEQAIANDAYNLQGEIWL